MLRSPTVRPNIIELVMPVPDGEPGDAGPLIETRSWLNHAPTEVEFVCGPELPLPIQL
jgi:hypothetical protein